MSYTNYEHDAKALIEENLVNYRGLSYAEIAALPEIVSKTMVVSGHPILLTMFIQRKSPTVLLLTLQITKSLFTDMSSYHFERGLVFSINGHVREATDLELTEGGG